MRLRRERNIYDPADWGQPTNRKTIAAGALVALVAVAAVALVLIRVVGGGSDDSQAAPAQPPASPHTSAPSTPATSTCGLQEGGSDEVPTKAPDAEWTLNKAGVGAPTSPIYGPGKVTSGLHTCFAHDPTGALFALANFVADTTSPDVSKAERLSRAFKGGAKLPDSPDSSGGGGIQVAGFNFVDATQSRVSIELALSANTPGQGPLLFSLTYTLGWQDGDWKIVVPNGSFQAQQLTDLSGYVAWAGVS